MAAEESKQNVKVEIAPNGPILIAGEVTIKNSTGEEIKKSGMTALCRCGHSSKKPFCDGTHAKAAFKG